MVEQRQGEPSLFKQPMPYISGREGLIGVLV
jgi:hypothetical protein